MPYAKLLTQMIDDKGLSIKEVAERCKNYGHEITASYISIIKNSDNKKIPSDDVSRALAKACEAENDDVLIIEAYIDKAPKEFKCFLDDYKYIILQSLIMVYSNSFTDEQIKTIQKNFEEMPMAQLILQSNLKESLNFNKMSGSFNTVTEISEDNIKLLMQLKEPQGYEIYDNSMYPKIPQGSKVTPEIMDLKDYKDGDILYVIIKETKKSVCRKCLFIDEERTKITLFSYDQNTPPETFNIDDIIIMGKVKRIITELK